MKTNLLQNIRYGRNFFRPYLLILLVWICNNSGAFAQFGPDEGTGSSGDPYKISTPAQLDAVRSNLNKHFVLVNNIDLTQYITDTYSGVGWAPIGDYSNRFRGKFNGNGKTISGLWIDRTTNAVGLFGAVASPATISSLIVEIDPGRSVKGNQYVGGLAGYNIDEGFITDSYVIGSVEGTSYVGGLVGHNAGGSISRSYAIGSVEGTSYVGGLVGGASVPTFYPSIIEDSHADSSVSGDDYVGGLVGDNSGGSISRSYAFGSVEGAKFVGGLVGRARSAVDPWSGTIIAITTISYSHAASSVSGDENVGGLVGGSSEGSIITTSYAIGEVGKTDAVQVGGLVGYNNESIITNCYATGEVTGKDNVGGLLGQNDNYNSPDPTVTKCYATGKVTGTNSVGGFIGLNTGQFQFCTFDSETTEQIQGIGNHNDALGSLGTVLMMKEITYKNLLWDFDDVWEIEEDVSYPYFKPNPSAPIVITDAATSGVKVNLLNNAVNVVVYVNGVYHSTQTSNVDAGDQTFNLSGLKLGDVVKLVTYEPGKAPSDPVSGIVYATVTLNVVDENGDPVSGADITFDGVTYTDGTHVFKNLLGPSYSYKVEKSGYKTATGSVTVTGDKTEDVELFSKPIATGLDISGSKVIAVEVNGVAISFNRTVTAVTGGKITISEGPNTYTYTIPANANIVSGTGTDCKASVLFSDFLPSFTLTPGKSYTIRVEADAFISAFGAGNNANNNVGSFTTIAAKLSEANAGVTGSTVYTGSQIRPEISIVYKGITLVAGVDYRIKGYGTNVYTWGDSYVEIEGLGNYTGTRRIPFTITPAVPLETVVFPEIDEAFEFSDNLKLGDISLDDLGAGAGVFTWEDEEELVRAGTHDYVLIFTPYDAYNYDYSGYDGWDPESGKIIRTITIEMAYGTQTGILEWRNEEARIYPNPVRDEFTVDNGREIIKKVSISDISGRRITEATPRATTAKFNATSWAQGIYIITIESETTIRHIKAVKK